MAHWHGLAKLRMHNDLTLEVMDETTISLGKKFRDFTLKTCPAFQTRELPREFDARVRRKVKKSASKGTGTGVTTSNIDNSMEQPFR